MAIREGKWRCKSCSRVNRGRDIGCEGCGEPRGEVEFFLDDDAPEVTDRELVARAHAGVDWVCAYCSSSNAAGTQRCSGCGGPRDEGRRRSEGTAALHHPEHGRSQGAAPARLDAPRAGSSAAPSVLAGLCALPVLAGLGFAFLLFLCVLTAVVGRSPSSAPASSFAAAETDRPTAVETPPPPPPHHVAAVVTHTTWERSVHMERLRTLEETARSVPEGGRLLGEEQAIDSYKDVKTGTRTVTKTRNVQTGTKTVTKSERVQTGTRRVKTGTRSRGNGFFEDVYRTEPVYGTRTHTETVPVYGPQAYTEDVPVYEKRPVYVTVYRYEIQRWTDDPDIVLKGIDLSPEWPEVTLDAVTREKGRSERLYVTFLSDSGETIGWSSSTCADIARFKPGSRWDLLVDYQGEVLSVHGAGETAGDVSAVASGDGTAAPASR